MMHLLVGAECHRKRYSINNSSPKHVRTQTRPQPPRVRFETRINLSCVGPAGEVDPRSFAVLARWNRAYTMETVLVELRREMGAPGNRKTPQPPEGAMY